MTAGAIAIHGTRSFLLYPRCVITAFLCIFLLPRLVLSMSQEAMSKPRILCLHGLSQSASTFSNKIGGARRKLSRFYELDFLDGPITYGEGRGWWIRNEHGQQVGVETPFEYIRNHIQDNHYDAILGFSQGGLLATALALSGDVPNLKAIVTAGAPHVEETFQVAFKRAPDDITIQTGRAIPKLHFAGETDTIIPVERVEKLSHEGGNGKLVLHEKGHLFPTKASDVNEMMDFLDRHLLSSTRN